MKWKHVPNIRKVRRSWSALKFRYSWLRSIGDHPKLFVGVLVAMLVANTFAIFWTFDVPQVYFGVRPYTGVPDNLLSSVIEVLIIVLAGSLLILSRTLLASDATRLDRSKFSKIECIPDGLIVPVFDPQNVTIKIHFDHHIHYKLHPLLESLMRWAEIDREEYYVTEAGAVDIPKLALREINFEKTGTMTLKLGSASYYDMFLTHYSADLVLSKLAIGSEDTPITLRSQFEGPLMTYYTRCVEELLAQKSVSLKCHELLPNIFGVSGIVALGTDGADYVLLQKRRPDEIAAQGEWEWSFAGTLEATKWICTSTIPFQEFVSVEFVDEVMSERYFPVLLEYKPSQVYPIGFVFNQFYLFQPEMFVVVHYKNVGDGLIERMQNEIRLRKLPFNIVKAQDLEATFESYHDHNEDDNQLKELCMPGLKLLRHAGTLRDL